MKPQNIEVRTETFESKDIKTILITTQHSNIRVSYHNTDDIIISYEQPDWLDYKLQKNGNAVSSLKVPMEDFPYLNWLKFTKVLLKLLC